MLRLQGCNGFLGRVIKHKLQDVRIHKMGIVFYVLRVVSTLSKLSVNQTLKNILGNEVIETIVEQHTSLVYSIFIVVICVFDKLVGDVVNLYKHIRDNILVQGKRRQIIFMITRRIKNKNIFFILKLTRVDF